MCGRKVVLESGDGVRTLPLSFFWASIISLFLEGFGKTSRVRNPEISRNLGVLISCGFVDRLLVFFSQAAGVNIFHLSLIICQRNTGQVRVVS